MTKEKIMSIIKSPHNDVDHKKLMLWHLEFYVIEKHLYLKYKDNLRLLEMTICNDTYMEQLTLRYFNLIVRNSYDN
jgi:hypothetical protein